MDDDKIIPLELPGTVHEEKPEEKLEVTAAQMLRAFEDRHLGEGVSRVDGKIEKGHGAAFHRLPDKHKAHHHALMKLVDAEEELSRATAAHSKATIKHAEAAEAVSRHADAD